MHSGSTRNLPLAIAFKFKISLMNRTTRRARRTPLNSYANNFSNISNPYNSMD